uniref:Zona pellucida sperm-binding protein 4 n=1 Tax=Sphenodon punctatus TaxID=8508 RepID=A0A8D0GPE5_SPHPU
KPRVLRNETACGIQVALKPDGSTVVEASYAGCYVADWPVCNVTVVSSPAGDAPSPSMCDAIVALDRLPCAASPVAQGDCTELGCCYDPRDRRAPCYYGNKVTAWCSPEGQFSIAISKNATLPPLSLESVHLLSGQGGRCAPVSRNNAFVLYQFPLSACGTTLQVRVGQRIYENELVADRRVLVSRSGSITRDSTFRLTVRCSYSAESSLPVNIMVATLPPPLAVAQQGPLTLEMRLATDENYRSYYGDRDYPVVKVLRDPVYVEVRILQRMDPTLVLVLHQCWATPSTNPLQNPQWLLLEDGCPYQGDNYLTQLVPVGADSGLPFPSHHRRFVVRTFTFVDAASQRNFAGPVYFHCSASACIPARPETCMVQCAPSLQGKSKCSSSHFNSRETLLIWGWIMSLASTGAMTCRVTRTRT